MTLISRRDVLAGLAASSAASIVTAFGEERQTSAAGKAALLSGDERRQNADALLRYFAANAPQLLRAPDGILKHPSVSPSLPGKQVLNSTLGLGHALDQPGTLSSCRARTRRAAQAKALRARLRQPVELSRSCLCRRTDPDHDDRNRSGSISGSGSQRRVKNQAKPVFGQLGLLAADQRGEVGWLAPHFDTILRFYDAWTAHNTSSIGLLVWGDDVAIGDDNDPTTFGRPFFSSANLLLNCLFYEDLLASAELARRLGRAKDHDRLSAQAETLAQQIQTYCWDPRDSYFYSVDVQCVDRRAELIPTVPRGMDMSWKCLPMRIQMFTGFLPLWCGIASQAQADELVKINYLADDRLCARWGFVRSRLANRCTPLPSAPIPATGWVPCGSS
jgi:putative isomerase